VSVVSALGVCVAAYIFLAAYAHYSLQQEQLDAKTMRLTTLTQRQQELLHQRHLLEQAYRFNDQVTTFKLDRGDWLFYDVNVQGDFDFDAAQQIIEQCGDSALAYYWPIALEIKTVEKSAKGPQPPGAVARGDVQLTVKGQFVARR
jgi:hypothetical protein